MDGCRSDDVSAIDESKEVEEEGHKREDGGILERTGWNGTDLNRRYDEIRYDIIRYDTFLNFP